MVQTAVENQTEETDSQEESQEVKPVLDKYDLTDKQVKVIEYKLKGHKHTEISDQVGVTESTISRWVNGDQDFQDALREKEKQMFEGNMSRLQSLITEATGVIEEEIKHNRDIDTAIKLFDILGVSGEVYDLINGNDGKDVSLSEEEEFLIRAFRSVSEKDKLIDTFMDLAKEEGSIEINQVYDISDE